MAVVKSTDTDQTIDLSVTNGDLVALKEIKTKWKFKKIEDIIRFALAVMVQSDEPAITIKKGGKDTVLSPTKELLEEENTTQQST